MREFFAPRMERCQRRGAAGEGQREASTEWQRELYPGRLATRVGAATPNACGAAEPGRGKSLSVKFRHQDAYSKACEDRLAALEKQVP